ncbi:helix-turn-helix transcriptional regulator [Robbsia sp. KACC 23696]|uniref:helix-turn-helix domain-containing protein n=1 Tax=Robbsia sp. KACC 23696 TaxID=3149231 RepID=UPI00325A85C5
MSFDEIAALMSELGDADPLFKAVLASTGQELAPLATDGDGRATLTSLRMSAGLTQVQLAQLVGQKQSNISLYESGARSDMKRETMRLFCTALGCDMNTLDSALENSVAMRSSAGDFRRA